MSGVELERLKRMAMLELTQEEEEEVRRRLGDVIRYLDRLRRLDLSGVEPMYSAWEEEPYYRPDEPSEYPSDDVLGVVPRRKDRYVKAPRTI